MRAERAAAAGSIVSGIAASACCLGPLVLSILGMSGAAAAHTLAPWRPYLLVITYGLLGLAFYLTYRPATEACAPGGACAVSTSSRLGRATLWIAALIVVLSTAFPWYSRYLF